MELQSHVFFSFKLNVVFSFHTSFSRGTYNSSKLNNVRIPYGTTNFVAALINISINISIKRRARNNAGGVTAMSKTIASLPCP